MFRNNEDAKPISVIITTLAARAYQGEVDIEMALSNILTHMGDFVNDRAPRIPNPVNPEEDFADRWSMPEYRHLNLEKNFWTWLAQVQADFTSMLSTDDMTFVCEQISQKLSLNIDSSALRNILGISSLSIPNVAPRRHSISVQPASPWKERL